MRPGACEVADINSFYVDICDYNVDLMDTYVRPSGSPGWRWVFSDPFSSWTFEVNPSSGGAIPYKKKLQYSNSNSFGRTLIFEGVDEATEISFSGKILSSSMYQALLDWYHKQYVFQLTDDLDRTFNLYITEFVPRRTLKSTVGWYHSFDMKAAVLP